jgi:hypothetical protein
MLFEGDWKIIGGWKPAPEVRSPRAMVFTWQSPANPVFPAVLTRVMLCSGIGVGRA